MTAPIWVTKDEITGEWKVCSLNGSWPFPFPRFVSWREAYDYAYVHASMGGQVAS